VNGIIDINSLLSVDAPEVRTTHGSIVVLLSSGQLANGIKPAIEAAGAVVSKNYLQGLLALHARRQGPAASLPRQDGAPRCRPLPNGRVGLDKERLAEKLILSNTKGFRKIIRVPDLKHLI